MIGGRAVLDALGANRSLISVRLEGNHIPVDVLTAIQAKVEKNAAASAAREEAHQRSVFLNTQLTEINKVANVKCATLTTQMVHMNKSHLEDLETRKTELVRTQNELARKESACETLTAQLQVSREGQHAAEQSLREMSAINVWCWMLFPCALAALICSIILSPHHPLAPNNGLAVLSAP